MSGRSPPPLCLRPPVEAARLIRYTLGLPVPAAAIGVATLEQAVFNARTVRNSKPMSPGERTELEQWMS